MTYERQESDHNDSDIECSDDNFDGRVAMLAERLRLAIHVENVRPLSGSYADADPEPWA